MAKARKPSLLDRALQFKPKSTAAATRWPAEIVAQVDAVLQAIVDGKVQLKASGGYSLCSLSRDVADDLKAHGRKPESITTISRFCSRRLNELGYAKITPR